MDPEAIAAIEARLAEAGLGLLNAATLPGPEAAALAELRQDGRAVRVSGELYASGEVAGRARSEIVGLIESTGSVSLAEVRDALGTGRKSAQAILEYLDRERITLRRPDDRRVARRVRASGDATAEASSGAASTPNPTK